MKMLANLEMRFPYLNEAPDIKTFPESMGIRIEQQCMLDGHSIS